MRRYLRTFALIAAVVAGFLLLPGLGSAASGASDGASAQAQREATQPLNNAPFWRQVRKGESPYQTTQVRGIETNILVQPQGETWRELRNGPITIYGGWLIVLVFLAILAYYWRRGAMRLHEPRTGRLIVRFSSWERLVHWTVAITFLILAASGMVMLFGKYVLLPVLGHTLFAWIAAFGKTLHNFLGPLFTVSLVVMVATYAARNVPRARDWTFVRRLGDFLRGKSVPAGRFNAIEKFWFWVGVVVLGIVVSASGLVMDFPNFDQGREAMQLANVIHATAAVCFIALSFGHIYIGTIGMEGAYDAMRHGLVDEAWAKEHHLYWYEEVMAKQHAGIGGGAASTAPASPVREGWQP